MATSRKTETQANFDSLELRTAQAVIRPWRPGDAEALAKYANNRKIWRNMGERFSHPYTIDVARRWLEMNREGCATEENYAIVKDSEAIGGIGLKPRDDVYVKCLGIGYWLGEPFWGQGLMSDVVRLLTDRVFEHRDIECIQASVFAWNPGSGRVLEKAGFLLEGRIRNGIFKDGEFTDELLYGKLRSKKK